MARLQFMPGEIDLAKNGTDYEKALLLGDAEARMGIYTMARAGNAQAYKQFAELTVRAQRAKKRRELLARKKNT